MNEDSKVENINTEQALSLVLKRLEVIEKNTKSIKGAVQFFVLLTIIGVILQGCTALMY